MSYLVMDSHLTLIEPVDTMVAAEKCAEKYRSSGAKNTDVIYIYKSVAKLVTKRTVTVTLEIDE